MMKLNITGSVLDKLGFSEYWDEHGTWGYRTLTFDDETKFQIIEQCEMDDGYGSSYDCEETYVANHFYFISRSTIPKTESDHYELFFLHQMYECIKNEYPSYLDEFTDKCKEVNMGVYIEEYLQLK